MNARPLPLIIAGLALAADLMAGEPARDYPALHAALITDIDAHYPFFAAKGLVEDWAARKKAWEKAVPKIRDDQAMIDHVAAVIDALRDGHAGIVKSELRPTRVQEFVPGVTFLPATEGRTVIMSVIPALAQRLPPGTVVETIDGKPARELLDGHGAAAWSQGGYFSSPQRAAFFAYRLPLAGEQQGAKHRLRVRVDGKVATVTVAADIPITGWVHNHHQPAGMVRAGRSAYHAGLEGKVGYLYLRRIDDSLLPGIAAARKAHPDAVGWIVDLRGNTGGGYDGAKVKAAFADLPGKVAGIIDAGCISAGETIARDLVRAADARLFGRTTAGSSGRKKTFELPGLCTVRYTIRSFGGPDGKPIEFNGIRPHVTVEADPEVLRAGKNTEIELAREWVLAAGDAAAATP